MRLSEQQQDRLRGIAEGLRSVIGGAASIVQVLGLCVFTVALAFLVGGLLTADPDTTTFRDFLLACQNPDFHRMVFVTGCVIGVPIWVFMMMARASRVRYPAAAAAMGRVKRAEGPAPKGEAGHD